MPKQILCPANLSFQPRREYPYSPGTRSGHLIYTAGQVAWKAAASGFSRSNPASNMARYRSG